MIFGSVELGKKIGGVLVGFKCFLSWAYQKAISPNYREKARKNGFLNRMIQIPLREQSSHGWVKDESEWVKVDSRQVSGWADATRPTNLLCTSPDWTDQLLVKFFIVVFTHAA